MASSTNTAVLEITDEARRVVIDALSAEAGTAELALWIDVRGVEAGKYAYDLYFQALADATDDDIVHAFEGLSVVIPSRSAPRLAGARLEYSEDQGGGLVMVNPNAPSAAERAPGVPEEIVALGLGGALAQAVSEVLERDVNPSIASHGGRADLVAMDEANGVAYLALSGGCQGCAMSRMTLSNGIEVSLKEQLPQITEVIDVTDHAAGANPFHTN